ncbi:MAG TPA: PTS sugar transporter subunit IIA [Planctomycetota bacterium]|nr:PTS sugar transporter subunit IIA [Planctomycetota bacterium]
MRLTELLRPADLVLPLDASDKWDGIAQLVAHLAANGRVPKAAADALHEAVLARERSMSTGMERGIAIPHAAVDALERAVGALGIVRDPEGLAFESIDGRPTRLVVLLLIPRAQKLLHIRTLADVARTLGKEGVCERLAACESADEAWNALVELDR